MLNVAELESWKTFSTFFRIEFQFFTTFLKIAVILTFATFIHSLNYVSCNMFSL